MYPNLVWFNRSVKTAIQLGYCKSVPYNELDGIVTPNDIENDYVPAGKKGASKN